MSKLYSFTCGNINYHLHDLSPHTHITITVIQADASKKSKHRERQRKELSSKCMKQPPESLCFGERWRAYALWQVTLLSRLTSARANWPDFWQCGGRNQRKRWRSHDWSLSTRSRSRREQSEQSPVRVCMPSSTYQAENLWCVVAAL